MTKPLHTGTWECACGTYNQPPAQECRVCGGADSKGHHPSIKPSKGWVGKVAKVKHKK